MVGDLAVLVLVVVAWPQHVPQQTPADIVGLVVCHPVRFDQPSELDEQLRRKRLVTAEALRLGNKAKQPLGIAVRECRHGSQRYDECRMDSTPRSGEVLSW
jgi:hypothetical protein